MRGMLKLSKVMVLALGVAVLGAAPVRAERQPHMHAAIKHLRTAHKALADATHDKGTHRVEAMRLIEAAIKQCEEGIAFDNTHTSKAEAAHGH